MVFIGNCEFAYGTESVQKSHVNIGKIEFAHAIIAYFDAFTIGLVQNGEIVAAMEVNIQPIAVIDDICLQSILDHMRRRAVGNEFSIWRHINEFWKNVQNLMQYVLNGHFAHGVVIRKIGRICFARLQHAVDLCPNILFLIFATMCNYLGQHSYLCVMEDPKWLNITAQAVTSSDVQFELKDGTPIHYANKVIGVVKDSGVVEIQELEIPEQAVPHGYVGTQFHLVLAEKRITDMGYYVYNSIEENIYERTLVYEKVTVSSSSPSGGVAVTYRFPSGSVMVTKKMIDRAIIQLPAPVVAAPSVSVAPPAVVSPMEIPAPSVAVSSALIDDDDTEIPRTEKGKPYWLVGGRQSGFVLEEGKVYKWSGVSEGLYTIYRWTDQKFRVVKVKKKGVKIYDMVDNKMMHISDKYLGDNCVTLKKNRSLL